MNFFGLLKKNTIYSMNDGRIRFACKTTYAEGGKHLCKVCGKETFIRDDLNNCVLAFNNIPVDQDFIKSTPFEWEEYHNNQYYDLDYIHKTCIGKQGIKDENSNN